MNMLLSLMRGENFTEWLENLCCKKVVSTAAAVLGAGALAAGGTMYASSQAGKAAQNQTNAYRDANAATMQYQNAMLPYQLDLMENYQMPFEKDYAYPLRQAQTQMQLDMMPMQGDFAKQYMTARSEMLPGMVDYLNEDPGISDEQSGRIFGQAKKRIAMPFDLARQGAGERAASTGMMRSGAHEASLRKIDLGQAGAEAEAAIEQAIWEARYENEEKARKYSEKASFSAGTPNYSGGGGSSGGGMPAMPLSGIQMQPQQQGQDWGAMGELTGTLAGMIPTSVPYADPVGSYDVGYGAGYYPGGYAPSKTMPLGQVPFNQTVSLPIN